MTDTVSILIPILIFGAVGALIFLLGQYYATQAQTQRRLQAASTELRGAESARGMLPWADMLERARDVSQDQLEERAATVCDAAAHNDVLRLKTLVDWNRWRLFDGLKVAPVRRGEVHLKVRSSRRAFVSCVPGAPDSNRAARA